MVKYKVVSRIVADEDCFIKRKDTYYKEHQSYFQSLIDKYGFICYKIIAGLYIFYITPEVYEQGVKVGLIEEIKGIVKDYPIENMFLGRGQVVNHRMKYALEHSDIDYLEHELNRVNDELGVWSINVYSAAWYDYEKDIRREEPILSLAREIEINTETMTIVKNENMGEEEKDVFGFTMFSRVTDYEGVLDTLVDYLDREYMNSRHIVDKFKDSDFYDVDNWMQRLHKFEFKFGKNKWA